MDPPKYQEYLDQCMLYLGFEKQKYALGYCLGQRREFGEYVFDHETDEDIIVFQAHKEYYMEICKHELDYHPKDDYYTGETHRVNMYLLDNYNKKFTLASTSCICEAI